MWNDTQYFFFFISSGDISQFNLPVETEGEERKRGTEEAMNLKSLS